MTPADEAKCADCGTLEHVVAELESENARLRVALVGANIKIMRILSLVGLDSPRFGMGLSFVEKIHIALLGGKGRGLEAALATPTEGDNDGK